MIRFQLPPFLFVKKKKHLPYFLQMKNSFFPLSHFLPFLTLALFSASSLCMIITVSTSSSSSSSSSSSLCLDSCSRFWNCHSSINFLRRSFSSAVRSGFACKTKWCLETKVVLPEKATRSSKYTWYPKVQYSSVFGAFVNLKGVTVYCRMGITKISDAQSERGTGQ